MTKKVFFQKKGPELDKAIIFIHGSGGTSNIWKEQLKIDIGYQLIALDLPSHANSEGFTPLSLDLYTDVIRNLIEFLNLKHVILAGHSLGGAIIQQLHFQSPDKIVGLILIGTGGRLRVSPMILNTIKGEYQKYLHTLFTGAFSRKTDKEIINEVKKEIARVGAEITYNDFSICDKFDILDKVHKILIPCLIIVGSDDNLTPVKYSEYFHEKIRHSEMCIIKDAGHMVMIEKPEEVNNAIKNFITKYFK